MRCKLPSAVHVIDTEDHPLIKQPMRHYGPWKKNKISGQVKDMLRMGVITPSNSEWSANVVLVPKKSLDGEPKTMPITIDCRDINKIIKTNIYPMRNIQSLLDCLHGSMVYSSIDLFNGYWNLHIRDEDKEKTAFRVPGPEGGVYQFERLPFGLQGAPGTFSKAVNEIFSDVTGTYMLPYLDDFTVFSKSFAEHMVHLEDVLNWIQLVGLKAKPSKCHFGKDKIAFLGFQVSKAGLEPSDDKLETVQGFKPPVTIKQLKSFLGLTNFYRHFVKDYATIADPLTSLTAKSAVWKWDFPQQLVFQELKSRLLGTVLAHFNPVVPVEIHTDTSNVGLGAVLTQKQGADDHVLAFASRSLNKAERNYGATHLELLVREGPRISKSRVNETYSKEAPRFNIRRSNEKFTKGDLVLRWKPLHKEGLHDKLPKKWVGPFQVVKKLSSVNYRIVPIIGKAWSGIVHIEHLKRYHERDTKEPLFEEFAASCVIDQSDTGVPDMFSLDAVATLPSDSEIDPNASFSEPARSDPTDTVRPKRDRVPPARFREL